MTVIYETIILKNNNVSVEKDLCLESFKNIYSYHLKILITE